MFVNSEAIDGGGRGIKGKKQYYYCVNWVIAIFRYIITIFADDVAR